VNNFLKEKERALTLEYINAGMTKIRLDAFPGWELVKSMAVKVVKIDWNARFVALGGLLVKDRMAALKMDPVWQPLIADLDEVLEDGMGWRQIDRDECLSLGLILPEPQTVPQCKTVIIDGKEFNVEELKKLSEELRSGSLVKAVKIEIVKTVILTASTILLAGCSKPAAPPSAHDQAVHLLLVEATTTSSASNASSHMTWMTAPPS
jgi:hypothetical protein